MDLIKAENITYLPRLINENLDLNKFIFNVETNASVESVERVILDYKKKRGNQWKFDIDFEYVLEDEKYTFTIMVTSKLPIFIAYIDEKKLKFHVYQEGEITDSFVIPQIKVISYYSKVDFDSNKLIKSSVSMQGFLPYAGDFFGDFYDYSDRNDISLLDFPKTDFSTHHVADFLYKYFVSY